MSVKAMGLVWDLECPKSYGDVVFKPSHKYILIAYADHADHLGKNIWPAIPTISRKTGLDDRSVQRLTHDLEDMGLLVEDGQGPRGTNKWRLPYSEGGDKLSPVTICQGDKNQESLGDIPSGDIPSGDNLSPEFKDPEQEGNELNNIETGIPEARHWRALVRTLQTEMPRAQFEKWLRGTKAIRYDGNVLFVAVRNELARDWLDARAKSTAERMLVGIMNQEVQVQFVVADEVPA